MTWILYIIIIGAMIYMMSRGGGCCGGGHANHGGHEGSQGGGCCGGHSNHDDMNHSHMNNMGHSEDPSDMDMVQDPVCGMYVSKQNSISRVINGRTYYFCSESCANEFKQIG